MGKFYDEEGNEVEGLSKEEADKLAETKANELLSKKEEELKNLNNELDKLKGKDYNWEKLRKTVKEGKEQLSSKERALLEKQEELNSQFTELEKKNNEERLNRIIKDYVDDEEGKKKLLFHYERIKDDAKDEDSIRKKVEDAYKLTHDGKSPNSLLRGFNVRGSSRAGDSNEKESEYSQNLRQSLKIKDEDVKKYKGNNWKPKI